MYRGSCTVCYPNQQMYDVCINNTLYIVSTATRFNASASSSGGLNLVLC